MVPNVAAQRCYNSIHMNTASHRYAVVVAGGSGTRLWPLSRRDLPKQMQKFVSDKTLIDETVDRLSGIIPSENIFISTSVNYADKIKELLPNIPPENIIVEPTSRGTTAAFALFAATIYDMDPDAAIFSLASDHAVTGSNEFRSAIEETYHFIETNPGNIALVGIKPDRPDAGLGYIKIDAVIQEDPLAFSVEKFIEKPSLAVAKTYLRTDEYYWNAAYYGFKAKTLLDAYEDADPEIMQWIRSFMKSGSADDFAKVPIKAQEIEFIDSSKYPLVLIPAEFQWSDIGNWQALHSLLASYAGGDMVHQGGEHIDVDSKNCLVMSTDNRLVATVGLDNIAIISTPDVLLVLNKDKDQDIKQLLESLKEKGLSEYL